MTLILPRHFANAAYLIIILGLIAVPEIIIGFLFELLHVLFECIELALDELIEHLFHTELHETQVIVFYIICAITLYALYRLMMALPFCFQYAQTKWRCIWLAVKARFTLYWSSRFSIQKP